MNDLKDKLIEIFCNVDDFNNVFINELRTHQLSDGTRKRIKPGSLNESEVMTIVIYFHLMRYRDFKHYYLFHVCERSQEGFIINLLSGLIAYSYLPKKPSLNLEIIDQSLGLSF